MFKRAPLTLQICDILRNTNGEVSWEALANQTSKQVWEITSTVQNARRYLERDEGIVFETIPGVGLRRLSDQEKIESSATFSRKIRRTAIRGVTRLNAVRDMSQLSNQDQLAMTLRMAVFQAVQRSLPLDG